MLGTSKRHDTVESREVLVFLRSLYFNHCTGRKDVVGRGMQHVTGWLLVRRREHPKLNTVRYTLLDGINLRDAQQKSVV